MKRIRMLLLILSLIITALGAAAQIVPPPKSRLTPRYSRNRGSQSSLTLRRQEPRLQATATSSVIVANCPDAQALGGACGYVPVPLHRDRPNGETINIYFELYSHSNSGPAESAILANIGGPGVTTTGLRALWLGKFASNLDVHDLLLIDDRGRGLSGTIGITTCSELQHGNAPTFDQAVAECAHQLEDDNSQYATGYIAADTDDVRAALGYDKVDYYGGSQGGVDAIAYATRFGSHLRSLVLDSPQGPAGLRAFSDHFQAPATIREVTLDCRRSPTCSKDHSDPATEWSNLIETIRDQPVRGNAYDASGNRTSVSLDEVALLFIAVNPTGAFVNVGEFLAAADALNRGDDAPLLRLGAESFVPWLIDYGDPTVFSTGAAAGSVCMDWTMPYEYSSPVEERLEQYAADVSRLPDSYFRPFSKTAGTDEQNSIMRLCLYFEEASRPRPVVPPDTSYPPVPTLIFASDIDAVIPLELAQKVGSRFPENTFIPVAEACHEPTGSIGPIACSQCALSIANRFIETLQPGDTSCAGTPETVWPAVGRFPRLAADAEPAETDPAGVNQIGWAERKVVSVAVATGLDALKRSTIGSGSGVGLRAGTFQTSFDANGNQTTTLTNCAFTKDVTVNGTLVWGTDRSLVAELTVSGSGTAGGTLHIEGSFEAPGPVGFFKVSGKIGGRLVAVLVPEA
jgi:pimeloyl-ACP methyl ester carboxylesterase